MKFGLIGEHLGHSFSKAIHEKIGGYVYEIKEIEPQKVEAFFKERDFVGVNVTIPYKEKVIPMLDFIDEHAKKIGAVNTVINKNDWEIPEEFSNEEGEGFLDMTGRWLTITEIHDLLN